MPEPLTAVAAWLATYALHSTCLLLAAGLAARLLRTPAYKDWLWKAVLVGGLLTATLQAAAGIVPMGGRWAMAQNQIAGAASTTAPSTTYVDSETHTAAQPGAAGPQPAWLDSIAQRAGTWGGWPALVAGIWITGAALRSTRLTRAALALRRRLAGRRTVTSGPLRDSLDHMQWVAGWRGPVRLSCAPGLASPLVAAAPWGAAEICLPAWALNELSEAQQAHLLAHELAHVVRRDSIWLWLCAALETVLWFQPLHGRARRAWQAESEFVCDDWAARLAGSRRQLAECLTTAAGWVVEGQAGLAVGLAGQQASLAPRVERLLAAGLVPPTRARRWAWGAGLAMTLLLAGFAMPGWRSGRAVLDQIAGARAAAGANLLFARPLWDEIPLIDPRLDAAERARLPDEATDVVVAPGGVSAVLRIGYALTADLYMMDLDTGSLRALTTDRGGNIFPYWSPDGRWLAYVSHRDVNMEVYVMPATGGPSVRVTRDSDWHNILTWNQDGTLTVDTRGDENWTYIFDPRFGVADRWHTEPGL